MFARYALPPNRHGYCGPDDPGALFDTAVAGPDAEIEALAKAFDGAWPYLELIATANRIADHGPTAANMRLPKRPLASAASRTGFTSFGSGD